MLAKVRICWLDSRFAVTIVMKIAATMSVLAAQRFGDEIGVQDGVGTCPILTLAKIDQIGMKFESLRQLITS